MHSVCNVWFMFHFGSTLSYILSIEKLQKVINSKTLIEHTFSYWVCLVGDVLLMPFLLIHIQPTLGYYKL